jgi:hypothetical protein
MAQKTTEYETKLMPCKKPLEPVLLQSETQREDLLKIRHPNRSLQAKLLPYQFGGFAQSTKVPVGVTRSEQVRGP